MPAMPQWAIDLWESLPDGPYTCDGCGRVDSKSYVQPQLPRRKGDPVKPALCGNCINSINYRSREKHKVELAALPRCEVDGCTRRGNFNVGNAQKVLLCGRHCKAARREHYKRSAGAGFLAMFDGGIPLTRESLLKMAERKD